jgi:hypothetical protein
MKNVENAAIPMSAIAWMVFSPVRRSGKARAQGLHSRMALV